MRKSMADGVIEHAQLQYDKALAAGRAYLAPTGTPTDSRTIDRQVARMSPQDVATLAQTNPQAAEQAARRMEVIDARSASTAPQYPDIVD